MQDTFRGSTIPCRKTVVPSNLGHRVGTSMQPAEFARLFEGPAGRRVRVSLDRAETFHDGLQAKVD
jgi:hypothetical protein